MKPRFTTSLLAAAILGTTTISTPTTTFAASDADATKTQTSDSRMQNIFDGYQEENKRLNPIAAMFQGDMRFNDQFGDYLSAGYLKKSEAMERKYLKQIKAIDRDSLSSSDKINYDIFVLNREQALESFEKNIAYKNSLAPISQFFSAHSFFAQLGSGQSAQPFNTVEDYEMWIKRAEGFSPFVDQAIANMEIGIKEGIVRPTVVIEKSIPQVSAHAVDDVEQSIFMMPIKNMPEGFSDEDKKRLTKAYRELVEDSIVPAYQRLNDYLQNDYLEHTRETVGLSALPGGKEWYEFQAKTNTTTDYTPEEIHEIGLSEAKRIFAEMQRVKDQVGFKGDMQAFFKHLRDDPKYYFDDPQDLLDGYEDLRGVINPRLDRIFKIKPKADYEIRAVEAFREKSQATASYMAPAPDGSRPGVFYVNTYDLKARPKYSMEALSLHEASPGHHFQIAIAQELENLPDFRRFGGFTAFSEGWGLYAESLGEELGMYTDPYQYFGRLYFEIWRANRLVVDTGMHYKGWTREQAIEFMKSNSPITETDVIAEVERYIAIPGQALAYKMGELKIRELRNRAEKAFGDDFDIREFHSQVLTDGSIPLSVLERKIDEWIAASK